MSGTSRSFLIDTNAAIALVAHDESLSLVLNTAVETFVSVITLGEMYFGAEKSGRVEHNRQRIVDLANAIATLAPDDDTASEFGKIKQHLRAKGRPIPDHDIWIAALAKQHDLILITHDAHFKEVDNLSIETW